jgi:hypothetical protein
MVNEFLAAQSRRFAKPNHNVGVSTLDADLKAPRVGTTVSPFRLLRTDRGSPSERRIEELYPSQAHSPAKIDGQR